MSYWKELAKRSENIRIKVQKMELQLMGEFKDTTVQTQLPNYGECYE